MQRLLVIAFFPAFSPPMSGGEQRLLNLYRALSATHDVTLLTSTDFDARYEELWHSPRFRELRFPKDEIWRRAYATLERSGVFGDLSGLAFALAVADPRCALRQVARDLETHSDAVIHEFPFSEPIFADGSARTEIYNSHNFEASLLPSIVHGDGVDRAVLKLLRLESAIARRAKRVFATSQVDAEKFRLFHGVEHARICPNGFDEAELSPIVAKRASLTKQAGRRRRLLFTGSAHHPNVDAACFLVGLAAALPQHDFLLAGGVTAALGEIDLPANVTLVGSFTNRVKSELLADADLFLNPVTLGSGTSLKAIEALAAGIPLVSAPEGVRGLDVVSREHALVVPRSAFGEAIAELVADAGLCEQLASAGRAQVRRLYAWSTIAERLASDLASLDAAPPRATAPLCLALNDYAVAQPDSGGKARIVNLLGNLDRDVVLVSFGERFDVFFLRPSLLHVTVPKTGAHRLFEAEVNDGRPITASDCVAALFVSSNRILAHVLRDFGSRADVAIFEHCYMAAALDALPPNLPVVYSAHNIEETHKAALLQTHPAAGELVALVRDLETALVDRASVIVCCTSADAQHFGRSGTPTIFAPNGCLLPSPEALANARAASVPEVRVGFLGSGHAPNVEAARFIVDILAPAFPGVVFEFVGDVCPALADEEAPNIRLRGTVSEARKTEILAGWTLALNPVTFGGGSSLKLPDYLAHELPVLTTVEGSRGFAVGKRGAGVVAALDGFVEALRSMLGSPAALKRQRFQARRYATDELAWDSLMQPYRGWLATLMSVAPPRAVTPDRSLLVVTYRYTEPALGGAEDYLAEVLARIRPRFATVDLAAIDIGPLTNDHHFGSRHADADLGPSARIGELFDDAFYFAPDPVLPDAQLARCRRLERIWAREEQDLLLAFTDDLREAADPHLLAGFYGPEHGEDGVRRWTAPTFSILAPAASRALRLTGYSPRTTDLRLSVLQIGPSGTLARIARQSHSIAGGFAVECTLPIGRADGAIMLIVEVDEHEAEDDHRPLGLLLDAVSVLVDAGRAPPDELELDLAEEVERILRARHPERWMAALRATAQNRPAAAEADFAAARGPHSAALQNWLATHGGAYDTVLVQGIPFDTVPGTVDVLGRLPRRPRIVALPHFHGDDRFYYWRRYLDAFAKADATLVFSQAVADTFGPSTKFVVVPGGGVPEHEHRDDDAVAQFRALHPGTEPFFLVLGRKTGSKGYDRILRARAALATRDAMPAIVMIGPDEDGVPVQPRDAVYLGRQPRAVVRGALAECLALVTMSESESFGIVLCEAWLFGKPVIANGDCLAFRELIRDDDNGILVSTEEDLALAMDRLAGDPAERNRMGRSGRATVRDHFTWDRVAEAVLQTLM